MTSVARNKIVVLSLLILFMLPGISAWFFFTHPGKLTHASINRGTLLAPPFRLTSEALSKSKKWGIVLWIPGVCGHQCLDKLDQLSRVRLALGRHFYEVDLLLLASERQTTLTPKVEHFLQQHTVNWVRVADDNRSVGILGDQPDIFILDPAHYLVLQYSMLAPLDDVFHDIKQLIKTE